MKSWKLLSLFVIGVAGATSQTVYRVPADTKGNSIVLTVANESQTTAAQAVSVKLVGNHPALTLTPASATRKTLQASGTSDITFTFAVGRDVKPQSRDTLNFEIRDKAGDLWTKPIIVEYVGPQEYRLDQNFPNPFNPTTTIYYDLPSDSRVSVTVYDMLGRVVAKLVDEEKAAGYQTAQWDARGVASGAYIYRMTAQPVAGGRTWTNVKKLMVLK